MPRVYCHAQYMALSIDRTALSNLATRCVVYGTGLCSRLLRLSAFFGCAVLLLRRYHLWRVFAPSVLDHNGCIRRFFLRG